MGGIFEQPQASTQCWPAYALQGHADDKTIRKNIPQAVVAPPQGDPLPYPPLASGERGAIRRVDLPKGDNRIALTFDLCEQPDEIAGYDSGIVNYLRQANVKATFFSGGKWFLTHKDQAQQLIADPLFEMGNHAWEHRNLRILSGDTLVNEIKYTQLAYEQRATELAARQCLARDGQKFSIRDSNKRLFLFRFPFGACNPAALDAVAQQGLLSIQWDVSSGDPSKGASAALIASEVLRHVRAGSIILFHANGRGWHSAKALPLLIPKLKAAGFKFATISELLYASGAKWDVRPVCFDSKPNDTDHYDDLARKLDVRFREFTARFAKKAAPAAATPSP